MPKPNENSLAVVLVTDINGNGQPDHGDVIQFTVTAPNGWDQISVVGHQAGVTVYGATIANPERLPNWPQQVGLSSYAWQSGPAQISCYLESFAYGHKKPLATLDFTAGA